MTHRYIVPLTPLNMKDAKFSDCLFLFSLKVAFGKLYL